MKNQVPRSILQVPQATRLLLGNSLNQYFRSHAIGLNTSHDRILIKLATLSENCSLLGTDECLLTSILAYFAPNGSYRLCNMSQQIFTNVYFVFDR